MSATAAFPEITGDVLQRYDVTGPRYTSYPTVPEWAEFSSEDFAARLAEAAREPQAPLSLYFHIPFCRELCTFCGCNVVIDRERQKAQPYLAHLALELDLAAARLGGRRRFSQLHWGGGTPTFLDSDQIGRLWGDITRRFTPAPDAEIAIEVDPVVTSLDQIRLLRELGFNRLSMGVQDFDPRVQETANRIQSFAETKALLDEARRVGFRGINLDLIYGLPHQEPATWSRTMERILELRPDRVAVYSFAYVPDLRHHMRRLPAEAIPRGAAKLDLFRIAYESFVGAGYRPIGMDHFALPDDELALAQDKRTLGRNFQGYTVKTAADVIAFGITGISDVAGAYAQNVKPVYRYYDAVASGRFATERGFRLSDDDRRRRQVISQIMCNFWTDLGPDGPTCFEQELLDLRALEHEGLLRIDGTQIELSPLGRIFVRNVAMVFDAYLRRGGKQGFSRTV
jgi:oxygen-independent coproporphyrinogen III oxidase